MKKAASILFYFSFFAIVVATFTSTPSCKEEDEKVEVKADTIYFTIEGVEVSNGEITSLGYNTVKFKGDFKRLQASTFKIVDYGYVVSSTTNKPTIDNNEGISHEGSRTGKGVFDSEITGLIENKTYYARIYLKREMNSTGNIEYGYHDYSISFKTKQVSPPIIINSNSQNITNTSFQANAIINDPNLLNISDYGHVWSKTNSNPDISNNEGKTNFGSLQSVFTHDFSSDISNLSPNTPYFVRAYAKNQYGLIGYSDILTITTSQVLSPDLKITNIEYVTGDFLANTTEKIKVRIKNEGIGTASNTTLTFNQANISVIDPADLNIGILTAGQEVTKEIRLKAININSEFSLTIPIVVQCSGGFSWTFNDAFSVIVLPTIVINNGLLSYFRFNNTLVNEITNEQPASLNVPQFNSDSPPNIGTSFSSDDTHNLVEYVTPIELQNTTPSNLSYTINCWVRLPFATPFYGIGIYSLNSNTPNNENFRFSIANGGGDASQNLVIKCNGIGVDDLYPNGMGLFLGEWRMLTLTINKNGTYNLYINGQYNYNGVFSNCNWGNKIVFYMIKSKIDNLRIYNRILSNSEIQTLISTKS